MENFDNFDEWLAICQSFSYKHLLMLHPVNLQAIHQSFARQSFVNGSFVKVFLRQTFALYSITPILEVKGSTVYLEIFEVQNFKLFCE